MMLLLATPRPVPAGWQRQAPYGLLYLPTEEGCVGDVRAWKGWDGMGWDTLRVKTFPVFCTMLTKHSSMWSEGDMLVMHQRIHPRV